MEQVIALFMCYAQKRFGTVGFGIIGSNDCCSEVNSPKTLTLAWKPGIGANSGPTVLSSNVTV